MGEVFPLTIPANGRAVLAALPRLEARWLIGDEWTRRRLPGTPADLVASPDRISAAGLADDLDEHTTGLSAIGFAFADWIGDFHAIPVTVPSTRLAERQAAVTAAQLRVQTDIDRLMAQPDPR